MNLNLHYYVIRCSFLLLHKSNANNDSLENTDYKQLEEGKKNRRVNERAHVYLKNYLKKMESYVNVSCLTCSTL